MSLEKAFTRELITLSEESALKVSLCKMKSINESNLLCAILSQFCNSSKNYFTNDNSPLQILKAVVVARKLMG